MSDTKGTLLVPVNLSGIMINGTIVPVFAQAGRLWYQLRILFIALGFPGANLSNLPTKIGNQFLNSGEFLNYKETWFGTPEGLSLYLDDLRLYQSSPTSSSKDKRTAHAQQLILAQWLPTLGSDDTLAMVDRNRTAEQAPENDTEHETDANDAPTPTEADSKQMPTNDEDPRPMDIPAEKSAGIDIALFLKMHDNLSSRISYLASCLSIPNDARAGEKMFAVLSIGFLHPNERIVRPQNDSEGIWGQEEYLHLSEAIRRSLLFGQ